MKGFIAGEDEVTKAIIRRILHFAFPEFEVISELPARGGQVKARISEFNRLSGDFPVILLTDLDAFNCAPEMVSRYIAGTKHNHFIFNVAVDEAEAWLMADRHGFGEYFGIAVDLIPDSVLTRQGGRIACRELVFPYKPSLYFSKQIIPHSNNRELAAQLTPVKGASKGPEYNSVMVPYILREWDITVARENSDSLSRMINRITSLREEYLFCPL